MSLLFSISLCNQVQLTDIQVDVEAEEAFVFHLAVLGNHEYVFFRDQVIDAVSNFLRRLLSLVNTRAVTLFQYNLIDHLVDDFGLWG